MKVFIIWSGERSHALADALHEWIPLVLHYVKPFVSQADIEAGQRWAETVAKELEASNFGIICVTRENVNSPWVLFEAGAVAKSIQGSRVIPLLLDLEFRDITGPLAQFQAKKADQTGLSEVVQSLNQQAPQPIPEDRVRQLFEPLWPQLEKKISSIPEASAPTKHARPQSEILEELVGSVRSLDSRLREVAEEGPPTLRHRRRRFHPMMLHELGHRFGEKPGDPIVLLMVASMFRDEMPWLYELGYEAYRAAKTATPDEALAARRRFQKATEFIVRGPFPVEEMGLDPEMMHMIFRELDHLIDHEPEVTEPPSPKAKRKRPDKPE